MEAVLYGAEWHASDLTELLCRLGLSQQDVATALGVEQAVLQSWSEGHVPAPKMALIALAHLAGNERARMAALAHRDIQRPAEQWLVVNRGEPLTTAMAMTNCTDALEQYQRRNASGGQAAELWHAAMVRAEPRPDLARVR
jgi:hypothetical protein